MRFTFTSTAIFASPTARVRADTTTRRVTTTVCPTRTNVTAATGNLSADGEGKATYTLTVKNITIDEILGRGVIVHAGPDDGGQPTGNAGARIAQGTIGLAMKPVGGGKKKKKKATSSAPINAICPVSGKKVNPAKTCKFEGKTVAFCCGNCQAKFAKNPAQFAAKIKAK